MDLLQILVVVPSVLYAWVLGRNNGSIVIILILVFNHVVDLIVNALHGGRHCGLPDKVLDGFIALGQLAVNV